MFDFRRRRWGSDLRAAWEKRGDWEFEFWLGHCGDGSAVTYYSVNQSNVSPITSMSIRSSRSCSLEDARCKQTGLKIKKIRIRRYLQYRLRVKVLGQECKWRLDPSTLRSTGLSLQLLSFVLRCVLKKNPWAPLFPARTICDSPANLFYNTVNFSSRSTLQFPEVRVMKYWWWGVIVLTLRLITPRRSFVIGLSRYHVFYYVWSWAWLVLFFFFTHKKKRCDELLNNIVSISSLLFLFFFLRSFPHQRN